MKQEQKPQIELKKIIDAIKTTESWFNMIDSTEIDSIDWLISKLNSLEAQRNELFKNGGNGEMAKAAVVQQ